MIKEMWVLASASHMMQMPTIIAQFYQQNGNTAAPHCAFVKNSKCCVYFKNTRVT